MSRNKIAFYFPIARGYTLMELIVVMFIVLLLSVIGVPSISQFLEHSKASSVRQQLFGILSESRFLALQNSRIVTICSLSGNQCGAELSFPMTSFIDANRNEIKDPDEDIVRVVDVDLADHISLIWNRENYFQFWPNGSTGAVNGSLSYCSSQNQDNDFRIVISRVGRMRVDEEETRCPASL